MKIAVTSSGSTLKSAMDPRFGRCSFFIVAETDDMSFEAISNPNISASGAGIQSARLIAGKDVQVVLTGNCGPNAHKTLSAAGVRVIVNTTGSVSEAMEQFKSGKLRFASAPNVGSHAGTTDGS
jgi:predicted Fe-Mo cluster-binding NifX family protein